MNHFKVVLGGELVFGQSAAAVRFEGQMARFARASSVDDADAKKRHDQGPSNDDAYLCHTVDEDAISYGSSFFADGTAWVVGRPPWGRRR